jgi:apolipoprotein D and lipocalin family protein
MKKLINIALFSTLFSACSSNDLKPLKTVDSVDVKSFMGKWYVIANIPTFIEKGAHNAIETYTWNEKENRIDVSFKFNQDNFDGPEKSYPQKAFIYDTKTNAEWRIQPFWPLKLPYLVIDLAQDYSYTVIAVPNRNYVWIMARTPTMPEATYQSILEKLRQMSFDLKLLQKVPQKSE